MTSRHSMLPIALVAVIMVLALMAATSGRSNEPEIAAKLGYPHHICEVNDYCEGDSCSRAAIPFIVYLDYENNRPRLEFPRVDPNVVMTRFDDGMMFETSGGEVSGTMTVFRNGTIDWTGTSIDDNRAVEHFASGICERERG